MKKNIKNNIMNCRVKLTLTLRRRYLFSRVVLTRTFFSLVVILFGCMRLGHTIYTSPRE